MEKWLIVIKLECNEIDVVKTESYRDALKVATTYDPEFVDEFIICEIKEIIVLN